MNWVKSLRTSRSPALAPACGCNSRISEALSLLDQIPQRSCAIRRLPSGWCCATCNARAATGKVAAHYWIGQPAVDLIGGPDLLVERFPSHCQTDHLTRSQIDKKGRNSPEDEITRTGSDRFSVLA